MQGTDNIFPVQYSESRELLSEFVKKIDGNNKQAFYKKTKLLSPVDLELLKVNRCNKGTELLLYEKHEFEPNNRHKFIKFQGTIAVKDGECFFIGALNKIIAPNELIKPQIVEEDYRFSIFQSLEPSESPRYIIQELIDVADKCFKDPNLLQQQSQIGFFKIEIDPVKQNVIFSPIQEQNLFENYILNQLPDTKPLELKELEQIHCLQMKDQFTISSDKDGLEIFTHGKLANILTKYIQNQNLRTAICSQENSIQIKNGTIIICKDINLANAIIQEIRQNTQERNKKIEESEQYKPQEQKIEPKKHIHKEKSEGI